jgi:IstB-like ATP binding protein
VTFLITTARQSAVDWGKGCSVTETFAGGSAAMQCQLLIAERDLCPERAFASLDVFDAVILNDIG